MPVTDTNYQHLIVAVLEQALADAEEWTRAMNRPKPDSQSAGDKWEVMRLKHLPELILFFMNTADIQFLLDAANVRVEAEVYRRKALSILRGLPANWRGPRIPQNQQHEQTTTHQSTVTAASWSRAV